MDSTATKNDGLTGIGSAVTDVITPERHAELDSVLQPLSNHNFDPAWILHAVINGSLASYLGTTWPIDPIMVDMTACEKLLASNQEIRELLEQARSSGKYSEIRKRREWSYQRSFFSY